MRLFGPVVAGAAQQIAPGAPLLVAGLITAATTWRCGVGPAPPAGPIGHGQEADAGSPGDLPRLGSNTMIVCLRTVAVPPE